MSAPSMTAAVCTRDRPEKLRRALRSLLDQTEPPDGVLVVDNAPEGEGARPVVERFPGVRYLRERRGGLDFARNCALREAGTEVVAFLDDDAVADPGWAGAIRAAFVDPRVGACTGRVDALRAETAAQRLFEANGGFGRGGEPVRLPADARRRLHGLPAPRVAWAVSIGSGCSLAVRREVALSLGGFDEALDLGEVLPGGGDHDLLWRVLEAGHEVRYEPSARALHEHRSEMHAAVDQIVGHQRALIAFLAKSALRARGRTRASVLAFLAWRLLKPGVRLIRRTLGKDPLPAPVLLRMWWNCWRGIAAYPTALRVARHRRGVS